MAIRNIESPSKRNACKNTGTTILSSILGGFGILSVGVIGYSIVELVKTQNTIKSYETVSNYMRSLSKEDMKRIMKENKEYLKQRDKEMREKAKYLRKNKLV